MQALEGLREVVKLDNMIANWWVRERDESRGAAIAEIGNDNFPSPVGVVTRGAWPPRAVKTVVIILRTSSLASETNSK